MKWNKISQHNQTRSITCIYVQHNDRHTFSKTYEFLLKREDQSSAWCCWCISSADGCKSGPQGWNGGRQKELSAYVCYGSKCGWSNRHCYCRWNFFNPALLINRRQPYLITQVFLIEYVVKYLRQSWRYLTFKRLLSLLICCFCVLCNTS